jgi:2-phosphosulfolactate phosphatase
VPTSLEVLFAPAEFEALVRRDLSSTHCVVFDVLRATSTIIAALANGAAGVVPVAGISEALRIRGMDPGCILAGERDGVRIRAHLTGGTEFDLGNSPREFTRERVSGRLIVTTTTNGTRALRACSRAEAVWVASLLNLGAMGDWLVRLKPPHLLLVCSGTHDQAAYEDVLAAGGLCERVWPLYAEGSVSDSALVARRLYTLERGSMISALSNSRNGKRLRSIPELRDDVEFCAQVDCFSTIARLGPDAVIRAGSPRI